MFIRQTEKYWDILKFLNKDYLQVILVLRSQDKFRGTVFERGKYLHTVKI